MQKGIEQMFQRLVPGSRFHLFNVNSRGGGSVEYGLTHAAIERANNEADLIVVGGSNLYEGSFRWPWGVHLEVDALKQLRVPLFLIGIGSGSSFSGALHRPSPGAEKEIKLLNHHAAFSGARDVTTFEWLQRLGIAKAKLMGDPATFIFNLPARYDRSGPVLISVPPRRFWSSKRQAWSVLTRGRAMFKALNTVARRLSNEGRDVVVVCNDPADLPTAISLFGWAPNPILCPQSPEDYFEVLSKSVAAVSGRLHTAVAAFSLGIPFVLIDVDQRTRGLIKTYQLEGWCLDPSQSGFERRLSEQVDRLLSIDSARSWELLIAKRDEMYLRSMKMLKEALQANVPQKLLS